MEETSRAPVQAGQPSGPQAPGEWTRVIVLAPSAVAPESNPSTTPDSASRTGPETSPASGLSAPLTEEFQRRDWFAVVQHDPYLALAELALRERAQAARAAWGLQRMEGLALVAIEPSRWPGTLVREMFSAVRRWLPPSVTVWTAINDRIDRAPDEEPDPATVITNAVATGAADFDALLAALPRGSAAPPHANGSDSDSAASASVTGPAAGRAAKPERLSREEIDMLLREDQHEHADDRAPEGQQ